MKPTKVKNKQRLLLRAFKEVSHYHSFVRDSKAGRGVKKLFSEIKGRFQGMP